MKKDARNISPEAQEKKRMLAAKLHEKGHNYTEISELVGVHYKTISRWICSYKKEGEKALKAHRRGRLTGQSRQLSEQQESDIQKCLIDKRPDQLKMNFALWTCRAVQVLIEKKYGLKMPIRTVGLYLSRWNFTPQKPLKKAYEQSPEKVKKWLEEDYPLIKSQAKKDKAEIYWSDETGIRNDVHRERGYAPKGKTPTISLKVNRVKLNMISAINNQGKVRFSLYEGNMNARILIEFFKQLIKSAKRKIYVILDNLRVHHAKVVKQWLSNNEDTIAVFYLPSYSPELNPDEYLNCDFKGGVHSGIPAKNEKQLKTKMISHMRMLQKRPNRVKKYFQHHKIQYAA